MLNTRKVETGQLSQRRILSVPCPKAWAKPKEKRTLTTGHPSKKTHLDWAVAAAKAPAPDSAGYSVLRFLWELPGRSLRVLLHHK